MNKTSAFVALAFVSLTVATLFAAATSLGEVAGPVAFNVSLGGSQTLHLIVVAEGPSGIPFKVVDPVLNTIANETTPTVTASPMSGTIPPNSQLYINITVYMPGGDKQGLNWTGVMQVVETAGNATAGGGASAQVIAGVAKIITITSTKAKFNIWEYVIPVILIIIGGSGGGYYYHRRRRAKKAASKKRAKAKKGRKKAARRKPKRRARAKKGRKRTTRRRRRR